MRVIGLTKPRGAVKAKSSLSARGMTRKVQSRDFQSTSHCWEYAEHKCWDPKDGELCLARLHEFHPVKRMIRSIGGETPSTYSQTLNG